MTIRTFKDAKGHSWRVWHVVPQNDVLKNTSPALAGGWLCFENDGEKRRLVGAPETWYNLSELELAALLGTAEPVKRMEPRPSAAP